MEPLIEKRKRPPLGLLVRVIFSNQRFDLPGEESADGRISLGGEDLGLAQRSAIEPDGDVLGDGELGCGHGGACSTHYTCYT